MDNQKRKVGERVKIAICDDEEYYREKIKNDLEIILQQRNIQEYSIDVWSSGEALCENQWKLKEYQVVFLDIDMKKMNGLETAKNIRMVNKEAYLAFITAYVDYAVKGYGVDAIRFLLKDALDKTLSECVDTILERMAYREKKEMFLFLEGKREVTIHKICFVESQKHKLIFCMKNEEQQLTMYGKMDKIEERLKAYGFIRIHKSFLVNVKEIVQVANYRAILKNGKNLPIPREKYRQVKTQYFKTMGEI